MTTKIPWTSSITTLDGNEIFTHGINQRDIINTFTFEDTVFFVLNGRRPSFTESTLLRAILIAYVSHGITTQSTLAVMQAADCGSNFLSALVAGFLVGSGDYHLGALNEVMNQMPIFSELPDHLLHERALQLMRNNKFVPGYGHRFFKRDPRADTLIQIATEHKFCLKHLNTALRLEKLLYSQKGICINLDGAAGSILLDLDFDARIAPLFYVLGRSSMQAASYLERLSRVHKPFPIIEIADVFSDGD